MALDDVYPISILQVSLFYLCSGKGLSRHLNLWEVDFS